MRNEVELPDHLPSRYQSWYHLYLDVLRSLEGKKITEETEINLLDFFSADEMIQGPVITFYVKLPLVVIKSRALDYVMAKLPDFDSMAYFKHKVYDQPHNHEHFIALFNNLLDISKK